MEATSLLKILVEVGLGSRRKLADAIKQGRVTVNGEEVTDFRYAVKDADRITVDGKPIDITPSKLVYLIMNKPEGVLTTASDERGRQTVLDIMPSQYRQSRLYPVGRLDKDSTGLLLLTNDGELTYRLTHPKFELEKEYLVHIEGELTAEERHKLEQGVMIEGGRTAPAKVREVRNDPPFNYSITIHEGKKRQVRLMFDAVGHRVFTLKRVRMGNLQLGSLEKGAVREISPKEVKALLGG